jgi:glyoxylase-like metal-dependent hydrolase (beta-lactamase superfamily II)
MKWLSSLAVATLLTLQSLSIHAQDDPRRSVTEIADGVYRLQNNFHYSMVVLTGEGAVVVDPINADAAAWIKSEVANLTEKPITHLIYSHSHGDHASGGAVLAENSEVIAQSNAPDHIDGVKPTLRFDDTHEFKAGDKTFELTWLGPGHGEDLIAVVVRPANVAFITDAAAPKRLPWRNMGGANIDDWISQVKMIESLDFDIFAPAHGEVGVKTDATDVRIYLEELKAAVLDGLKAGKTIKELQAEVTMEDYIDWGQYENWLPLNVQGMASFLVKTGQAN